MNQSLTVLGRMQRHAVSDLSLKFLDGGAGKSAGEPQWLGNSHGWRDDDEIYNDLACRLGSV